MYKVLADFKDLRDGGYQYRKGDSFPREGNPVTAERIAILSAPTPHRGALIGEVVAVEIDMTEPKKKKKAKE